MPRHPVRPPSRGTSRLVAVGLVAAVAMLSSFVHLVDAAVERGDALRQAALAVSAAPR